MCYLVCPLSAWISVQLSCVSCSVYVCLYAHTEYQYSRPAGNTITHGVSNLYHMYLVCFTRCQVCLAVYLCVRRYVLTNTLICKYFYIGCRSAPLPVWLPVLSLCDLCLPMYVYAAVSVHARVFDSQCPCLSMSVRTHMCVYVHRTR